MKQFYLIEVHDYMDMYPRTQVISMESEKLQDWLKHMNENYSGGTTTLKKALNREEAALHVINQFASVLIRPEVTTSDGSLDKVDVEFLNRVIKEFNACY
jgi:hypothetical protein